MRTEDLTLSVKKIVSDLDTDQPIERVMTMNAVLTTPQTTTNFS